MSGTFTGAVLADGQLPAIQDVLYATPALQVAYVKLFSVANAGGAMETVQIFINNGTARLWRNLQLAPGYTADLLEDGESLELGAGATLEGITTNAAAVDFVVSGVIES